METEASILKTPKIYLNLTLIKAISIAFYGIGNICS